MSKKVNYTIEKDYVKVWFDGEVHADALVQLVDDIVDVRESLPNKLKVLLDARRANFGGRPEDLKMILKRIKDVHSEFESLKLTIVIQNPYETAMSILMQAMLKDLGNVHFKVFSTEQAAASWLK